MIFKETKIKIIDNSDALTVLCINNNSKFNKFKNSSLGSTIKTTIKNRIFARNTIKSKITNTIVCSTKKRISRKSGIILKFNFNTALVFKKNSKELVATSYKAVLPKEIKYSILLLAPYAKSFI